MKSHKGMLIAVMLVISLGALGINAILTSSTLVDLSDQVFELEEEFELAYTPHDAIWIQNNSAMVDQATDESWSGNGSKETPYIITGYSFNQDTQPLRIWNTDLYWIFTGNLVDSDGEGMECGTWIEDASNGVITENTFRNRHSGLVTINVVNVNVTNNVIHSNTAYGMEFLNTITNCVIANNTIYDCVVGGIRVGHGSINSTVSDNSVTDSNGNGIVLRGGLQNCFVINNTVEYVGADGLVISLASNTVVSFNSITNATNDGLGLHGFNNGLAHDNTIVSADGVGISISYCGGSNISYNTVEESGGVGIDVISGSNTTMSWNTVKDCVDYALQLSDETEYFEVQYNTFDANGGTSQINDDGDGNEVSFNYYSDWTSPDNDVNGIVDNPYAFDGLASNEDPYPLTEAGVVPVIEEPTPTPTDTPLPMDLILIGVGALAIVIIISGVVMLRKR